MAQFADLYDEIGADDWMIPSEDLSRKKLIKKTPRYNIYKGDWFGDVLVYEPINTANSSAQVRINAKQTSIVENNPTYIDTEELRFKLLKLDISRCNELSRSKSKSQNSLASDGYDSAYASNSSTPQCFTKTQGSEFSFPSGQPSPTIDPSLSEDHPAIGSPLRVPLQFFNCEFNVSSGKSNMRISERQPSPIILNKDSYYFRQAIKMSHNIDQSKQHRARHSNTTSSWSELNELRLIAHEGFMLFMGASTCDEYENELNHSTSLVIQMNHPKAVSLFDLLHGGQSTDRFNLNSSPYRTLNETTNNRQIRMDISAKLNICQQVTDAMTYLHDKSIVHAKLTSSNIYIEPNQRVKISLIDDEDKPIACLNDLNSNLKANSLSFNIPALTYLSPELIRTLKINERITNDFNLIQKSFEIELDTNHLTKMFDVYSFGTLLFELFEERFPFSEKKCNNQSSGGLSPNLRLAAQALFNLAPGDHHKNDHGNELWHGNIKCSPYELIYQIGAGYIVDKNISTINDFKQQPPQINAIISACWSKDPSKRPQFKQLTFV